MNERLMLASSTIERIRHLWFDEHAELDALLKIDALFDALSALAPYECCHHVHYLWRAYRYARAESLCYLSRQRWEMFSNGMMRLWELAKPLRSMQ